MNPPAPVTNTVVAFTRLSVCKSNNHDHGFQSHQPAALARAAPRERLELAWEPFRTRALSTVVCWAPSLCGVRWLDTALDVGRLASGTRPRIQRSKRSKAVASHRTPKKPSRPPLKRRWTDPWLLGLLRISRPGRKPPRQSAGRD